LPHSINNEASFEAVAREEYRLLFLDAAAKHPEVRLLDSLRDNVMLKLNETPGQSSALLREWAVSHRLEHDWVLEQAAFLCKVSQVIGSKLLQIPAKGFLAFPFAYPEPIIKFPPWCEVEEQRDYTKRMVQHCKSELTRYLDAVARARGVLQERGSRENHLCWAVERVCLGRRWTEILKQHPRALVDPAAVRGGVQNVLARIGIPDPKASKKRS
jgi:hypothetical protein